MKFLSKLFGRKITSTGLLNGATDMHCHILPGVDDGIQDKKMALAALKYFKEKGFKRIILTPHIMEDLSENTFDGLTEKFEKFKEIIPEGIEVELAAEYMLDSQFVKHLEMGKLLTLGKTNKVLIETSYLNPSLDYKNQIYKLQTAGYKPVLAHPERYVYMRTSHYESVKEQNCLLQLNLLSLSGHYGQTAKNKAIKLLEKGFYDLVGTDTHRFRQIKKGLDNLYLSRKHIKLLKPLFEANSRL